MRKNNFESGVGFANAEEDIFEKDAKEREASSLEQYWKRFKCFGTAPKPGSPVEARLKENCRKYCEAILDPKMSGAVAQRYQRDVHDEICKMIYGADRYSIDNELAETVADFASLVTNGMTMGQAMAEYERHRRLSA